MDKSVNEKTKRINNLISVCFITFIFSIAGHIALAKETSSDKVRASSNDIVRGLKKGANHVGEIICKDKDLVCLREKIKNRSVELKDVTVDGAKKIKNKID